MDEAIMRTPTVRFTRILATAALAAGLGAAIPSGPAHATTLITGFDAADSYGLASFTENGFTITLGTANDPSAYGLVYPYTNFFLIGTDSATIVTITATDGGAFTFQGLSAFLYLGASDPADTLTAMR